MNRLALINRSDKPLYLMPGEIIIGGRQDRTIAQETVIPPGAKPVPINVFCVEHGRWSGRDASENARIMDGANASLAPVGSTAIDPSRSTATARSHSGQAADSSTAKSQPEEFIGSVGSVDKAARIAVQGNKGQGAVWNEVAQANAKSGVKGTTGDFAGNYADKQSAKRLEPYVKELKQVVADQPRIVGVAVAIDGKMDTLDVFESTPLFQKLWPKLLQSYALDAANSSQPSAKRKANGKLAKQSAGECTAYDARKFLAEAMSAQDQKSTSNGDVAVTTLSTEHILTFSAHDSRQSAGSAGGFGGGGFGGAIHTFGGSK